MDWTKDTEEKNAFLIAYSSSLASIAALHPRD